MIARLKTLMIVYHSVTGGTRQLAEAAAAGAGEAAGMVVRLRRAEDVDARDVIASDGFIFASPENLAAMSGMMKDFFDRTYYDVLDQVNGRPYATLICAGSDGHNAARQIERIVSGWRLKAIAEPVIVCTRATTPDQIRRAKTIDADGLAACRDLGKTIACGIEFGIY